MPLKVFLNNDMDDNQNWTGNHSYIKDIIDRKLILFMVGGSAASIYSPLLRFFLSGITADYILPIFIDRKFHSSSTSSAIEEIANYEEFCRLSLTKSVSTEPLLFVEENVDEILENDALKQVLTSITTTDKLFICTSVHSAFNTEIVIQLGGILKSITNSNNIGYGFFLPYLKFATNDKLSSILFPENDEERNTTLNINLRKVWSAISQESPTFIVGLSHKSIVPKSDYQINPFNIVHLIMAYAVSSSSNKQGGWYEYGVQQTNSFLSPKDIIQSDDFRNSLIIQDFSSLVYDFMMRENCLPEELKKDRKLIDLLQKYLNATSQLVLSLGDATLNPEICMLLRNKECLYTTDINLNFRKKTFFGERKMSKKELHHEIYKYIDTSKIVNSNMAANQILFAIQMLITDKFETISSLYF